MEKQKIIIMLNCLVMHKSFWKLQLPWTFHCLLYPEGGELEPEVSSLFSGTPNTRVVFLNMEVLKVLNSSLSWENGSIKGLQGLGFKAWAMCRKSWSLIFPSTKTLGGAFWTQLFPWHPLATLWRKNLIVYASEARPTFLTVIASCYG